MVKKKRAKSPNGSLFKVLFFVLGLLFILVINVGLKPVIIDFFGGSSAWVPIIVGVLGLTILVWLGRKKL